MDGVAKTRRLSFDRSSPMLLYNDESSNLISVLTIYPSVTVSVFA
jgi:hypothetical protein